MDLNVLIITIGVVLAISIWSVTVIYKSKKERESREKISSDNNETERLKLYAYYDFDKIDEKISKYIDDSGKLYKINNFEYKKPEELYLNELMMNEMIKFMIKDVRKKITPAIYSMLKLTYNVESEEELIEFLYEKIKLYVFSYSLEVNAEIEE